MNEQRYLLVVSGPSGSGKDTVVRKLMAEHPDIQLSVSATTRPPRQGEVDGVDYNFVTKEQFEQYIRQDKLLEYTCYVDNYYGTPKSEVDKRIQNGVTCVLVIEVEGAANVRRQYPGCTMVFIQPPSLEELACRLRKRGTECEERMAKRLQRAQEEMTHAGEYDYQLVNTDYNTCAQELYNILQARQAGEAPGP